MRASTPLYNKYSFSPGPNFNQYSSDKTPAATVIRQAVRQATTLYHIDLNVAAARHKMTRTDLVRKLNTWNETEVIGLKTSEVLNVYRIEQSLPNTDAEIKNIAKAIYSQLQEREQADLKRTDQVLAFITGKGCFSRTLAQHFGDELTDGKLECGHCTWCLTHTAVLLIQLPKKNFDAAAFNRILKEVDVRDDARFLAKVILFIINWHSGVY